MINRKTERWNLEPQWPLKPRFSSCVRATSVRCRPCGAGPLITQSLALAVVWLGRARSSLSLAPCSTTFTIAQNAPFRYCLIRTTVWARLVPSRLTGFGSSCQSTRVDPCPSTTPGPEPGREGYTQTLSQQTTEPLRGAPLCLLNRSPSPRCEPRATVFTQQCFWSEGSVTLLENRW